MNILLADDNAEYLELLKETLYNHGYSVHTATDGIQACEMLTTEDVDLIVSDVKMPRFDGIKLHEFARHMERHRHTKFIFITAYPDAYREMLTLDPEVDFFLDKSVNAKELVRLIDRLIFGKFAGLWV